MKKLLCIIMMILMVFMIFATALAMDDPVTTTAAIDGVEVTASTASIDWGQILTYLLQGVLCALAGFIALVLVYIIIRYLIPALPDIVQWLSDKRLLWLAKVLVNAAEVALGRYMGAEKRALVKQWLQDRGITITENIEIMISNAWTELNNKMIELGLKEAKTNETPASDDGSASVQ